MSIYSSSISYKYATNARTSSNSLVPRHYNNTHAHLIISYPRGLAYAMLHYPQYGLTGDLEGIYTCMPPGGIQIDLLINIKCITHLTVILYTSKRTQH